MRRELRVATAGVAAAACWVAVEPVWRRAFGAAVRRCETDWASVDLENALLWPFVVLVDDRHPDVCSGAWPRLARNPRAAAQEIASHAVFGVVLGSLLPEPD